MYEAGGGYRSWYLALTNTTRETCRSIHPVVVLVDQKRVLEGGQVRLQFYESEGAGARAYPVRFERSGEDESVGVFDDGDGGFSGFSVGAGKTVSVRVRLAVAEGAVSNDVVASAAVVRRHDDGDDGDWVGQSNDYRFRIVDEDASQVPRDPSQLPQDPQESPDGATPEPVPEKGFPFPDELAGTGPASRRGLLGTAAAGLLLIATGAGAMLIARRRRRR
ncbi:hypothetical protein [Streptomyces sp. NBC_00286]|uniref:hypothetical protein n=1 Tax=Streptomyces sp. NBC_00286 TaxID=2975701 RepID=UPI002E2E8369|nr:hypothetical protein [Streptomyces sp. NBC_00286]